MKIKIITTGIIFAGLIFTNIISADTDKTVARTKYAPGRLIVKLKEGKTPQDLSELNTKYKVQTDEKLLKDTPFAQETLGELKKKLSKLSTTHDSWYWQLDKNSQEYKNYAAKIEKDKQILTQQIAAQEELVSHLEKRQERAPKSDSQDDPACPTPNLNIYILDTNNSTNVQEMAKDYAKNPNVEYAEPDYIARIQFTPNDPYYSSSDSWGQGYDDLWGLKKIQADKAWDVAQGDGMVVAVVDTGINYEHEDIAGNMWKNGAEIFGNNIDDDNNGFIDDFYGYNFIPGSFYPQDPMDDNGHGTFTGGIIAALGNNGLGITGVAPKAKLMALKGIDSDGFGYDSDLTIAIKYAVDNGADIINNSWGSSEISSALQDIINYAYTQGCVVAAAAGNDNNNEANLPADMPNVISVAATNIKDEKAEFSNWGNNIDVGAPGVDITSTTISEAMNSKLIITSDNNRLVPSLLMDYSALTPQNQISALLEFAGLGYPADFQGKNFNGKIALIQRGELTFKDKTANAFTAGAVAVVIYNNQTGIFSGTLTETSNIPAVSISQEDGLYLKNLLDENTVNVSLSIFNVNYDIGGGTSFSAPFASGLAALILEKFPSITNKETIVRMKGTVDMYPTANGIDTRHYLGTGRINAYNALSMPEKPFLEIQGVTAAESKGDGDGIPKSGEELSLVVKFKNIWQSASSVSLTLSANCPAVSAIIKNSAVMESIGTNEIKSNESDPFIFKVGTIKFETPVTFTIEANMDGFTQRIIFETYIGVKQITTDLKNQHSPAIDGDKIVWLDERNQDAYRYLASDIYLYDLKTNKEIQITNKAYAKKPSISGNNVVWQNNSIRIYNIAENKEIAITGNVWNNQYSDPIISGNKIVYTDYRYRNGERDYYLCLFDLETNKETLIGNNPSAQFNSFIKADSIVWTDWRNLGRIANADIYFYNLTTNEEKQITTNPGWQDSPATSGNIVVWQDERNENGGDENKDIYVYDLVKNEERQITTDPSEQSAPSISGNKIVYSDYRNGNNDIYLYDLNINEEIQVTSDSAQQFSPAISGNKIVWVDTRNGNKDIYATEIPQDTTAPGLPIVSDEGDFTLQANHLYASWESTDPESGIMEYRYKITEGAADGLTVTDWTSAGTNTSVDLNNLSLQDGRTYYFSVQAKNNDGLWSEAGYSDGITVNLNKAPIAQDQTIATAEDTAASINIFASDINGDNITYAIANPPTHGTLTGTAPALVYTPNKDYNGNDSFTFKANDGNLDSNIATIAITINPVNDAPVLLSIGSKTIAEGNLLTFPISAADIDNDNLIYSAQNLPNGAAFSSKNQTFNWTPAYDTAGTYEVKFNVSDSNIFASENITITVDNINQPPALSAIGNKNIDENKLLNFTISGSDIDKDNLIFSVSALPEGANFNSLNGIFNWTPNFMQAGDYSITFEMSDGKLSVSETITITINNVNRAPIAENLSISGDEDMDKAIVLSAADPDADKLDYTIISQPARGTLSGNAPNLIYTPNQNYNGSDSFTFKANDGKLDSNIATASLTIKPVNDLPIWGEMANSQETTEGKALTFSVSAADIDKDNLEYSANLPEGAAFNVNTQTFTWTPNFNQAGRHSINFSVSDKIASSIFTVNIIVQNVNQPPKLSSIGNKIIDEGKTLAFTLSALDPDKDNLTYSSSNLPSRVAFNRNTGSFDWTPEFNQSGNYKFTFKVSDGNLSAFETITITVNNINRPPQIEPITDQAIDEGKVLEFNVPASDPDKDQLTYSASELPKRATYNYGTFRWTPEYNQAGTYPVTFTVSDGVSRTNKTINITVKNISRLYASINMSKGEGYSGRTIKFSGNYSSPSEPDGRIISAIWNFGDKTTSGSLNPGRHSYKEPKDFWTVYIYTASLTIIDDKGLKTTRTRDIYLYPHWMWHNYISKGRDWELWFLLAKYYPGKLQSKRIAP